MIKDLCIQEDFACIHSITPKGGGGKSKCNNEYKDIYDRFRFNINERKGIATSVINNIVGCQSKFGPQGIVIFDGKINNVNRSDAGSEFNDISGLWETTQGIQFPNTDQVINEIALSNGGYVEINIYEYKICGFFIDFQALGWCTECIRSLKEFYENTNQYELPYYGLSYLGIIKINSETIKNEDRYRLEEGKLMQIAEIYSSSSKIL